MTTATRHTTAAVHYSKEALVAAAEEWFASDAIHHICPQMHSDSEDKLRTAIDTYQKAVAEDAITRGDV